MSCNHIITSGNTYDQNTASGWRINSRKRARNSWVTVLSQHKRIAACRLQHPFADFDRRGFTRTIRTQHPNFCTGIEREINPFQDLVLAVKLTEILHRENVLFAHGYRWLLSRVVIVAAVLTEFRRLFAEGKHESLF